MSQLKISGYLISDLIRKKIIIAYALVLFLITMCLFWLEPNDQKAMLSIFNIILLITPLISLVFTTIHYYNSYEFRELLLCQPVSRIEIFYNEFIGIAAALTLALIIGIGIPLMIFNTGVMGLYLLLVGVVLTLISSSISYLISVKTNDKSKGIGWALMIWFYFAVLYDGVLLWLLFFFNDYPLEKFTLLLTSFNPIDLNRISVLLKMEIGAMMGYSGAVFKDFLGKQTGILSILIINLAWISIPLLLAKKAFLKKDF